MDDQERRNRSPMEHRHLVNGIGYEPSAIDDIIDRGDRREWLALRDAALTDPARRKAPEAIQAEPSWARP